jgi:hypothetical protein
MKKFESYSRSRSWPDAEAAAPDEIQSLAEAAPWQDSRRRSQPQFRLPQRRLSPVSKSVPSEIFEARLVAPAGSRLMLKMLIVDDPPTFRADLSRLVKNALYRAPAPV